MTVVGKDKRFDRRLYRIVRPRHLDIAVNGSTRHLLGANPVPGRGHFPLYQSMSARETTPTAHICGRREKLCASWSELGSYFQDISNFNAETAIVLVVTHRRRPLASVFGAVQVGDPHQAIRLSLFHSRPLLHISANC